MKELEFFLNIHFWMDVSLSSSTDADRLIYNPDTESNWIFVSSNIRGSNPISVMMSKVARVHICFGIFRLSLWDSENYETLQIWLATQSTLWHKVWVEIGDRWLKFSSVWQSFSLDAFGIPIWYLWTPNMQMEWSANPNGLLPLDLSASSSSFAAYKLWKLLQSWAFFIELKDITRPQCVLHILLWSIHSFALHFCYR